MPYLDQFVIASSATPNGTSWDLEGASWDVIPAASVPVQTSFALLVSVLLTPEEARSDHTLTVSLRDAAGAAIGGMTTDIRGATEEQLAQSPGLPFARFETVLVAQGVVFPDYGRYELHVLWDDEPMREPMLLHVLRPE